LAKADQIDGGLEMTSVIRYRLEAAERHFDVVRSVKEDGE
jgi:hypothetical protein